MDDISILIDMTVLQGFLFCQFLLGVSFVASAENAYIVIEEFLLQKMSIEDGIIESREKITTLQRLYKKCMKSFCCCSGKDLKNHSLHTPKDHVTAETKD